MTQDRRITDKLPGHPLQWDDSASPSAAPAAGQAGLAKVLDLPTAIMNIRWGKEFANFEGHPNTRLAYKVGHRDARHAAADLVLERADELASLAAPVAADTEQATIDTPEFREMLEEYDDAASDSARRHALKALIDHIDSVKLAPLATPADAEKKKATLGDVWASGGVHWDLFPGFLIDHREGDIISEEGLQFALADMLKDDDYLRVLSERATPADAGAGQNDEQLRETDGYKLGWMEGMQEGAELAAGGEKTAADVEAEFADLLPGSYYMDPPDGGSPSVLEQVSRMAEDAAQWRAHLARQSPAPVTAEPVQSIDTPEFRALMAEHWKACGSVKANKAHGAVVMYVNDFIATHSAPADRDAILEDVALQCEAEKVHVQKWHPSSDGDEAYNAGCDDCAKAIRALKSMERAADAKGEQQ